jgi:hypothetical protein
MQYKKVHHIYNTKLYVTWNVIAKIRSMYEYASPTERNDKNISYNWVTVAGHEQRRALMLLFFAVGEQINRSIKSTQG